MRSTVRMPRSCKPCWMTRAVRSQHVEGDLAVQALGRLSARHRHVLKLREGSGWTYQEIANHEGVEIRTGESLIWRARRLSRDTRW